MAQQPEKKRDNRILAPVIGGAAALAVLLGVIIVLLLRPQEPTVIYRSAEEENRSVRGVVTKENAEEMVKEMVEKPVSPPMYYDVSMNMTWHFPDGASPSTDSFVRNSEENETPVYFDVVMADDETNVIYQSPVLPLGTQIEHIQLDKDLDAGTYNCVCIYHLVDDAQRTLSTLRMALTVIVEQ